MQESGSRSKPGCQLELGAGFVPSSQVMEHPSILGVNLAIARLSPERLFQFRLRFREAGFVRENLSEPIMDFLLVRIELQRDVVLFRRLVRPIGLLQSETVFPMGA